MTARSRRRLYRDHLGELAVEARAELRFFAPVGRGLEYSARVCRRPSEVVVLAPEPVNRQRYLSGLHEFGHLLGGDWWAGGTTAAKTPTGLGLYGELSAWVWAFRHARVPPTRRDALDALNALIYEALRAGADLNDAYGAELVPEALRPFYIERLAAITEIASGGRT